MNCFWPFPGCGGGAVGVNADSPNICGHFPNVSGDFPDVARDSANVNPGFPVGADVRATSFRASDFGSQIYFTSVRKGEAGKPSALKRFTSGEFSQP